MQTGLQEVEAKIKKPESRRQMARGFTFVEGGIVVEGQCFCCVGSTSKTYETKSPDGESAQVCQMCLRDNLIK